MNALFYAGHPFHTEGLTCLTITSDSGLALTGSKDSSVYVVNITTGKTILGKRLIFFMKMGISSVLVCCAKISMNDIHLETSGFCREYLLYCSPWAATGGMDKKLIVWDLQHSLARCTCDHEDGVTCLSWLGMSRFLATGCVDGKVRLWDSLSGDCVRIFSGHSDAIQSLAISSNGEFLVSVSIDGTARVFEIADFR
ncbi:hypothetical protein U1Q18_017589 [Sarracenia purpurea var. burkii]